MNANPPKDVDTYIKGFPTEIHGIFEQIRATIKKAAPDAKEVISYSMPAYKQNGILVYFAGNKEHLGFYPTGSGVAPFLNELKDYKTSKGAIQFPYNKPIPLDLIEKIVKFRVLEDSQKTKKKK